MVCKVQYIRLDEKDRLVTMQRVKVMSNIYPNVDGVISKKYELFNLIMEKIIDSVSR